MYKRCNTVICSANYIIFGNMLISIMVQIKFDRHIIYKMCVLDGV